MSAWRSQQPGPVGEDNCRRVGMGDPGLRIHLMNCILDYDPLRPRMGPLIERAFSSDKILKTDYKAPFCYFVFAFLADRRYVFYFDHETAATKVCSRVFARTL